MTPRGPFTGMRGASDPPEPDDPAADPGRTPADLGAVRRTDAVIESLATRRTARRASAADPDGRASSAEPCALQADDADSDPDADPAVRLLRALISDVDDPDPEREASEPGPPPAPAPSGPGPRRRGPRTIVALGVAGAVLAGTGVAAAGSDVGERASALPAPSTTTSGGADTTAPTDTAADTHAADTRRTGTDSTAPPPTAGSASEPRRPTPAPVRARAGDDGSEPRPRHPFPSRQRPRFPDVPGIQSSPPRALDDLPREIRRHLQDPREHPRKHRERDRGRD